MESFFEKLKKGMGIEEEFEESIKEPDEDEKEDDRKKKVKKIISKKPLKDSEKFEAMEQEKKEKKRKPKKLEIIAVPIEEKKEEEKEEEKETEEKIEKEEKKEKWSAISEESEGQLAIDVYQTDNDLVIQSAVAGVKPENLDISIEKDIITIRGSREKPFKEEGDYFSQECFWGAFSREIILPVEVDPGRAIAEMKEGVLTIRMPKILREKRRKVIVKG